MPAVIVCAVRHRGDQDRKVKKSKSDAGPARWHDQKELVRAADLTKLQNSLRKDRMKPRLGEMAVGGEGVVEAFALHDDEGGAIGQ